MRSLSSLVLLLISVSIAAAQQGIGWRTDGTGRYPDAQPPKTWGPDKNVVWKTPLPNFSVATPILVGDKIFVCSEPTSLICLNKADGKILWERKVTYADIPWSEEEKAKLKAEKAVADGLAKQQQLLEKYLNVLMKTAASDKDNAELKKSIEMLRTKIKDLRDRTKELPTLMKATEPRRDGTAGYSQCTPVSNGKQVFVMFGNCLVACYDLDGTRRWLTLMEHSTADYGHGSSPLLVGDTLIVHYTDLAALNIKDGSVRWRHKVRPLHGTCIAAKIGNDDVLISPMGVLIRVSDGKILADKLGQSGDNAPILHDGVVYFVSNLTKAVRLPKSIDEKPEALWKANLKGGDYWFASPVYHDGLLYAVNGNAGFSVVEAQTGKLVYFDKLDFGGRVYPSICLAGKYLYVSSDNGTTLVLEPGRKYKEVARNQLETFRSTPVFEGRRMYVRTLKHLWCIGE
jgi:outer membrane protein assembly factor BamB